MRKGLRSPSTSSVGWGAVSFRRGIETKETAIKTENERTQMAVIQTAAERLRQHVSTIETEIVDVTGPSGFVYKFKKPSKTGMLFGMGRLPQIAASGAVQKWTDDGLIEAIKEGDPEATGLAKSVFDLRDRVLSLSHSPKIVLGDADASKDEVSSDDVPDEDLAYFLQWVAAGGEESSMLGTFPRRSPKRPMAGANRKKRRAAAKSNGRARAAV